ncbi:MAG: P-loop NTPase [Eubacteriales bacterium]|nr:P-loop NTPase [Eubacteriales bacterium]
MSQIITVASGKGGTGKSHFCAGFARALSSLGKKVALIDGAMGLRTLDMILGVDDKVFYTYVDVINGDCTLEEASVECGGFTLFSPPQNTLCENELTDFSTNFSKDLQNLFDFIIIDSGSGISNEFIQAISPADKVILITEPTSESVRCVDRAAGVAEENGKKDLLLVINKVNPDYIKKGIQSQIITIIDMLGITTIGIVPDFNLKNKKHNPDIAFNNIARRFVGEKVPIMDL